jgi:methionyl-tRNA formyltransferase
MVANPANILLLGPGDDRVVEILRVGGDSVATTQDPVTADELIAAKTDFLVSFGYRHILSEDVLRAVAQRAINLHISYLPWNRGAHPVLWSIVENTPSGVTIHEIDAGVDTGPILAQRRVDPAEDDTLRTLHARLQREIVDVLSETWPAIRAGALKARPQSDDGTVHRVAQLEEVEPLLKQGWDTRIRDVREGLR